MAFTVAARISLKLPKGEKETRNILGPFLRTLREKRGLTQLQVIVKLQVEGWDISRQVYSFIEDGSRLLSDVEVFVLLRALGSDPADLTGAFEAFFAGRKGR